MGTKGNGNIVFSVRQLRLPKDIYIMPQLAQQQHGSSVQYSVFFGAHFLHHLPPPKVNIITISFEPCADFFSVFERFSSSFTIAEGKYNHHQFLSSFFFGSFSSLFTASKVNIITISFECFSSSFTAEGKYNRNQIFKRVRFNDIPV